jgi:hypothetical protein
MTLRKLKAFFTPYPLYLFVIDLPSFDTQKRCYLAISVSTILFGKPDQRQAQSLFVIFGSQFVMLSGSRNTECFTGSAFRGSKFLTGVNDSTA